MSYRIFQADRVWIYEVETNRSLNVNNGEIHSVDEPLPRETGWRIQVGMLLNPPALLEYLVPYHIYRDATKGVRKVV